MTRAKSSKIGFVLGAAFLGALTGCAGYVDKPHHDHARGYPPPPPVYLERGVAVQDDYVYYPGYEVYYSSNRRQYIYQDGLSWVTRPAPPRVSVDVLFASPSVRLDSQDSPAVHHAKVVQQNPKHWAPPPSSPDRGQGNPDSGREMTREASGAKKLLNKDRQKEGKEKPSPVTMRSFRGMEAGLSDEDHNGSAVGQHAVYRIRAGTALTLTSITISGGNVVITHN